MLHTKERVREFQELYNRHYGEWLEHDDANEAITKLVNILDIVYGDRKIK